MSPVWLRASARNDPGSLAPLACPPATTTIKQRGRRLNCRSVTPASLVGSSSVPLVWRNAAPVPPPRRAQADARTIPPASGVSPSAFALTSTDSAARAEPAPTSNSPATASTATTASDHDSPPQKRRVTTKKSAIARIPPPPADAPPRANLPHRPSAISPAPSAHPRPHWGPTCGRLSAAPSRRENGAALTRDRRQPRRRKTSRRTCTRQGCRGTTRNWGFPSWCRRATWGVLSLAKLASGRSAEYWLEQARGRVSHADSVASGVEDYYLAGPEARGRWVGSGAAELGLAGEVDRDPLLSVLAARDPRTGDRLPGPIGQARGPGYDLMFSVPKSASILFGGGDERVQRSVLEAQRAAVAAGIAYLERHACLVRRGHGGVRLERTQGFVAAAFEHRTSRAGDPQVHTHVLVANAVRRQDGRWSALDGRAVYAEAKAAGYVHEAVFRRELARALGVEWRPPVNGIADIEGISHEAIRAFSRRSAEIDEYLAERGQSGAAARQVAALRTRERKDYQVTPAQLAPEWRARSAGLGLDEVALRSLLDQRRRRDLDERTNDRIAAELVGRDGLTANASTFDRRDVVEAIASRARHGATLDEIES